MTKQVPSNYSGIKLSRRGYIVLCGARVCFRSAPENGRLFAVSFDRVGRARGKTELPRLSDGSPSAIDRNVSITESDLLKSRITQPAFRNARLFVSLAPRDFTRADARVRSCSGMCARARAREGRDFSHRDNTHFAKLTATRSTDM